EAAEHPAFAYKPETGEEHFHSFAGVPIVRLESPVGVLAVQHADPRRYEDVEIEALQTVAMVLSEMIAGARLVDGARRSRLRSAGPLRLPGLKLVSGMAKGQAVFHEPRVVVEHTVAEDIEAERERVYGAFRKMREQIDNMARDAEFGIAGEHQEILETYRMFAYDEGWSRRINAAIDSGLTAEAAIERVQQRTRARMREIDDPLLQERMHDLEDLSNRLLRIVSGRIGTAAQTGLAHDAVLIARNLGPAELLEYDRRRLKAVLLEEGSLTSHMTIVARAIGVPVIGRLHDIRHSVEDGETILVDGDSGSVIIRPTRHLLANFEHRMALSQKRRAEFAAIRNLPATTTDGFACSVMVNAGLAEDAATLPMSGAEGIGLFRTEFQFLVSATLPGRDRQQRLYTRVLEAVGDRPVVFRTVDIGGDKALPYLTDDAEEQAENPAMGWRALRLSLDRSTLMKAQARALIEASAGKVLRVMFPMVSEPWEYEQARALFEEQVQWARNSHRKLPTRIDFGAMLEVPSLAEMLDQLLPQVDFISIGTNDLTQFLFAADRSDPRLAQRYDWLSPAIFRFLKRVIDACGAANVPVRICGEMAGRPLEAMALIGIGAANFSITPAGVGPLKAMIRSLDASAIRSRMDQLLAKPPKDIRKALSDWARRRGVTIE
ncbi:MAG TPA: phosphoenolpyruvate--protein phosphotransferase, partial [Sphingomicrobium sp.]|nr:phosphoenolpyruvate--protein phosphotransferase [Sphingomicrobium sp.]